MEAIIPDEVLSKGEYEEVNYKQKKKQERKEGRAKAWNKFKTNMRILKRRFLMNPFSVYIMFYVLTYTILYVIRALAMASNTKHN